MRRPSFDVTLIRSIFLVAPPVFGSPTGGTLYNRYLVEALTELGASARVISLDEASQRLERDDPGAFLCDSLFISSFGRLLDACRGKTRPWLLLHYLPSLVRVGRACAWTDLLPDERQALSMAGGIIVTGSFMQEVVRGFSDVKARVMCVEPGVVSPKPTAHASEEVDSVRAILVGALTEGKGVLPFLQALEGQIVASDSWSLSLVGSASADVAYANRCRELVARDLQLRRTITFVDELLHQEVVTRIGTAHLMVSASRMESYGMALSEARSAGVPIVALEGGNVDHHIDARSGGQVCRSPAELGTAVLHLVRTPSELRTRRGLAERNVHRRGWHVAAHEFARAVGIHLQSRGP